MTTHEDTDPHFAGPAPSPLTGAEWRALETRHRREVDELTADHRRRAAGGLAHPVEDFLFTYYSLRPAQLRRWHPGAGIVLFEAGERSTWRFHRAVRTTGQTGIAVDVAAFIAVRGERTALIRQVLTRTASADPNFGCFGLHEWAMVYRSADSRRHSELPLRLGDAATDDVVRGHQIRCSHHDAFRFFTPPARPLNLLAPAPALAERTEQPGCLHATMDLYKWAYQLLPLVPSSLVIDCFRLARDVREIDMRASPYDLTSLGYSPIRIETSPGKAQYVAAQRAFQVRGEQLRARILAVLDEADEYQAPRPAIQGRTAPAGDPDGGRRST